MTDRFNLIATNAGYCKEATIKLSTIVIDFPGMEKYYESCLFSGKDSEVLLTYFTMAEAVIGHNKLAMHLGLK